MIKKAAIVAIKAYKRVISPSLISSCRYVPTCSDYAIEALEEYGVMRGALMALWRVLRCNPFARGGFDPVKKENKKG